MILEERCSCKQPEQKVNPDEKTHIERTCVRCICSDASAVLNPGQEHKMLLFACGPTSAQIWGEYTVIFPETQQKKMFR